MVGVSLPRPSVGWPFFFRLLSAGQIVLKRAKVETSVLSANTNGVLTCDFTSTWNRLGVKNDQNDVTYKEHKHEVNVPDELLSPTYPSLPSWSKNLTKDSSLYLSPCVPPGTLFSGTHRMWSRIYIKSEGAAKAVGTTQNLALWHRVTLCN